MTPSHILRRCRLIINREDEYLDITLVSMKVHYIVMIYTHIIFDKCYIYYLFIKNKTNLLQLLGIHSVGHVIIC